MKINIIYAAFACLGIVSLSSCKKDNVPIYANESIVSDSILYKGSLIGGEFGDVSRGDVSVEKLTGKRYLVFKNFSSSNGPAVHVYLTKKSANNAMPATDYLDLGLLKATSGTFNYELTTAPNIDVYKYALVWCALYNIQFGIAELKK